MADSNMIATPDSLMKNSLLYMDYSTFEKELIDTFPELIDRQLLTWLEVGSFAGALLMFTQPESVGGKALIRKISSSTFGKKIAALAFKYGPNRVVRATATGANNPMTLAAAKRAGLSVSNAFRENMFYITAGVLSDSRAIKELLDLANQKLQTPPLVEKRAGAVGSYVLALFNQTASDSMDMFEEPGIGASLTISYDDVLKALWMTKSFANFERGEERLDAALRLDFLFGALCGLLRDGFEDANRITISQFNETNEGCFGGLKAEAYEALALIPYMADQFDRILEASPLSETRNSMVIAWANGLLMKTGANRLKLFVRPLAKTADYLDFLEVLE